MVSLASGTKPKPRALGSIGVSPVDGFEGLRSVHDDPVLAFGARIGDPCGGALLRVESGSIRIRARSSLRAEIWGIERLDPALSDVKQRDSPRNRSMPDGTTGPKRAPCRSREAV